MPPGTAQWMAQRLAEAKQEERTGILGLWVHPRRQPEVSQQTAAELNELERPNGGFDWSNTHNSPFEISKIALMNFPRSHRDVSPGNLILNKTNPDGTVITSSTEAVTSYKYLGVIFDPGLH